MQRLWTWARNISFVLIIALGVLVGGLKLFLPVLESKQAEIEQRLAEILHAQVTIGKIDVEVKGVDVQLVIDDVFVYDEQGQKKWSANKVIASINTLQSILFFSPRFDYIRVNTQQLHVRRDANGQLFVADLPIRNTADKRGRFGRWIAKQDFILLQVDELYVSDARVGSEPWLISDVQFRYSNNGVVRKLEAQFGLPAQLGGAVRVVAKSDAAWSDGVQVYVKADLLELAIWKQLFAAQQPFMVDGVLDLEAWMVLKDNTIDQIDGEFSVAKPKILRTSAKSNAEVMQDHPAIVDAAAGYLRWQKLAEGWQIHFNRLRTLSGDNATLPMNVSMHYYPPTAERGYILKGGGDRFSLASFYKTLQSNQQWAKAVQLAAGLEVSEGTIEQFRFEVENRKPLPHWAVSGRLQDLSLRHTGARQPVAVSQLSGEFLLKHNQGRFSPNTSQVASVHLPSIFTQPLQLPNLAGDLYWQRNAGDWIVDTNNLSILQNDFSLSLLAQLVLQRDQSPFLLAYAELNDAEMARVRNFLPRGIMREKLTNWLDMALVGGQVKSAKALFHGRVADFPFLAHQGVFEARAAVRGVDFNYGKDWPVVKDFSADLEFNNQRFTGLATDGTLFDVAAAGTRATIEDLRRAKLSIRSALHGEGSQFLDFIRYSPLHEQYAGFVDKVKLHHPVRFDLDLLLTLYKLPPEVKKLDPRLSATVHLTDNRLESHAWHFDAKKIRGKLRISNSGVSAKDLQGQLFSSPITVDIVPQRTVRKMVTTLFINGLVDFADVRENFTNPWLQFVHGESNWFADLQLTSKHGSPSAPQVSLNVHLPMEQVKVDLPYPMGKQVQQVRPLILNANLVNNQWQTIAAQYGDDVAGRFGTHLVDGKMRLKNAVIRLGADSAELAHQHPDQFVVQGTLDRVNVGEWLQVRKSLRVRDPQPNQRGLPLMIRLASDQVQFLGQQLTKVDVEFTPRTRNDEWSIALQSDQVKGDGVLAGVNASVPKLTLEFAKLALADWREQAKPNTNSSAKIQPADIPALDIQARQFSVGEKDFGELTLQAKPDAQSIQFNALKLHSKALELDGSGVWHFAGAQQQTQVSFKLHSADLRTFLDKFGFVANVEGDDTRAQIEATWPGAPFDFELAHLRADLGLTMLSGRFVDIEPGAGRVFGLLSLQSLPRRLKLDFSDLFKKGASYDRIEGNFEITDGHAYTSNLHMEGPAGNIEVSGRTGLLDRDYDQSVVVYPRVSSTLPIAGTVVGGPGVGAVLLFAERLFRSKLDKLTKYEYSVKGSWDNPTVKRIE